MKLKYEQIDMENLEREMMHDLEVLKIEESKIQKEALDHFHSLRDHYLTMYWTSYICYLLDYKNEKWIASENFFGSAEATMQKIMHAYYETLNDLKNKSWLESYIGKRTLQVAKVEKKLFDEKIMKEIPLEQEQKMKYLKLIRSTTTMFDGEEKTLGKLSTYLLSDDRVTRKNASLARFEIFQKMQVENEEVLSQLIQIRNRIATSLGYPSYVELSYDKMYRFGYDEKDIQSFRKNIKTLILPLVKELKEEQRKNLEVDTLYYYDDMVHFKDGVSKPKGDVSEIVEEASHMYHDMHPILGKIFNLLKEKECMDLESRDEKSTGGICTYLPDVKLPIFIASFHQTNHDIDVITHEFGHAVQLYLSKDLRYHENRWPSFDVCEIHSQTMEYLVWDHLDRFFETEKDTNKYRFDKLIKDLEMLLYICLVDEFQHEIYRNPNITKQQRNEIWHRLEDEYQPYINKDNEEYLMHGAVWQKQSHIITNPFYYIDYALSSIIAFQFFTKYQVNPEQTIEDYLSFCKLGGQMSFVDLVEKIGFSSPFESSTIEKIATTLKSMIEKNKVKKK